MQKVEKEVMEFISDFIDKKSDLELAELIMQKFSYPKREAIRFVLQARRSTLMHSN